MRGSFLPVKFEVGSTMSAVGSVVGGMLVQESGESRGVLCACYCARRGGFLCTLMCSDRVIGWFDHLLFPERAVVFTDYRRAK